MDSLIKKSQSKPFSDQDIKTLCENKVKIVLYSKLKKYSDIDKILDPHDCCIILYETKHNYGHWCALLRQKINEKLFIEHFDSYGMKPDAELAYVPNYYKKELGEDTPRLTYLLAKATQNKYHGVIYNEYPLQKVKNDISTCGRWCGLRIVLKDLTLEEFINLFKKQKFDPDWYVTALTSFV